MVVTPFGEQCVAPAPVGGQHITMLPSHQSRLYDISQEGKNVGTEECGNGSTELRRALVIGHWSLGLASYRTMTNLEAWPLSRTTE